MDYKQHILACPDAARCGVDVADMHGGRPDPGCTVILCERISDGVIVWHSHAPATEAPEGRLNPSVPAEDWRAA